jgi:MFS family permease
MLALSRNGPVLPLVIALGLVCGLPAGSIMSLPARVLDRETRPIGMGLFYTVYYVGMLVGPAIGGRLSVSAGTAHAALDFGVAALLACPLVLWLFHHTVTGRYRPAVSSS